MYRHRIKTPDHRNGDDENSNILVSVVVPIMNNARTLEATMHSILSQTHTKLDVVVWDDCSDDDSVAVIEPFLGDARVSLRRSETRLGIPESWTAVSRFARGDFVKLVCADDLIAPTLVADQIELFMQGGSEIGFVSCNRNLIGPMGNEIFPLKSTWRDGEILQADRHLSKLVRSGTTPFGEPMCVLFRRELLEKINFWSGEAPFAADLSTYARALGETNGLHSGKSLASFRLRPGQHSKQRAKELIISHKDLYRHLARIQPHHVGFFDVLFGITAATLRIFLKLVLRKLIRIDVYTAIGVGKKM